VSCSPRARHRGPTQQEFNLALETEQLGTSAEAPDQSADVSPMIVNLTWDCDRDWIAPNPRETPQQSVLGTVMAYCRMGVIVSVSQLQIEMVRKGWSATHLSISIEPSDRERRTEREACRGLSVESDGQGSCPHPSLEVIERLILGESPVMSEVEILRRGTVSEYSNIITNYVNVGIYRNHTDLLSCPDMSTHSSGTQSKGPFRIYTPASLGDAIRHYRTEAGLTQAELAERAGLHRSYLSELETGKETEQVKRILRVLRQLGVRMTLDKADW